MPESSRKLSINHHFRREAIIPVVVLGSIIVLAGLGALVGPWLFEHFR